MIQEAYPLNSDELALSQAVFAWYSMESKTGYSPFHLVYGTKANNHGVLETLPGEAEIGTMPLSLEENFRARDLALQNHTRIRTSNKLRLAILAKTLEEKNIGDWVMMK